MTRRNAIRAAKLPPTNVVCTAAVVGLLALGIARIASADDTAEALRAEMQQRNAALVERGFNLTNRIVLGSRSKVAQIELLVPPSSNPHEFSFWAHALGGDARFRVTTSDGRVLASWEGPLGETTLTLALPVGRNTVEIDGSRAESVFALLGVKGPILPVCPLDSVRASMHSANASTQFYWPYLLYVPRTIRNPFLLVAPNNTGFATTDRELLAADGRCVVQRTSELAEGLGTPLLVPLFPRPPLPGAEENLYLHALSRASLVTEVREDARVDLQLIDMLDDATRGLAKQGTNVSHRVLLTGFSASGSFVSRFAMLHPDRVLAVASGSPGGWPIVPVPDYEGAALPYPVGTADLKSLVGTIPAAAALGRVAWFFFLGDRDANDSVPYRDSFSKADEALILEHFGATPAARWKKAEQLYRDAGLNARFKLYPGAGHEVSPEMRADTEAFFVAAMQSATKR